ncbi:MAG: aminotransferase class I/II-fold pyridoxal phosphate-dependent enzyme [Planctomycetes bacterium]|nr:aminotransferase class I/II-fold pyridoxal phosphate-dependent enzyme [Planctomycetota bacterium]
MNDRLRKLQTYPMVALERRKHDLLAKGLTVFDFGTGDPREPTPALIRQAFLDGTPTVSQYPSVAGHPAMRQAAAGYLQRRFGITIDADRELLPTLGSKEAIFHLPMILVQVPSEKDLVVYGEPAYPVFEIGALFAEAWTYPVALSTANRYLMDPDLLPESVLRRAAVVFLNYPHNPTGQCLPESLFKSWVAARDQYGFTLVSDECYADLDYEEPRPRCVLEFGKKGCLAVHSLSKRSGMTGYRSGFVAGDPDLIALYQRFRAGMGVAPQDFVQAASTVAWRDAVHVEERRALFSQKRQLLLRHFQELGLKVYPGTAGLFLWVEVPAGISDVNYAERCLQKGILVSPGSFFGAGQERFFRVALVPSVAECRAAIAVWPR